MKTLMFIILTFLAAGITALTFINYTSSVYAAGTVEQDDCRAGFVVNSDQTGCIPINSQNDPDGCAASGGGADAVERCLAQSSRPCELSSSFFGLPTWYKYLDASTDSTGRCSPVLSGANTEEKASSSLLIGIAVLEALIRISGIVAVVMIFWAGFKYITSQGNPDAAAGARKTAINSVIGLVIVVLSTTIISFVGSRLS